MLRISLCFFYYVSCPPNAYAASDEAELSMDFLVNTSSASLASGSLDGSSCAADGRLRQFEEEVKALREEQMSLCTVHHTEQDYTRLLFLEQCIANKQKVFEAKGAGSAARDL